MKSLIYRGRFISLLLAVVANNAPAIPTIEATGGNIAGFNTDYQTLRGCCGVAPQQDLTASSTLSPQGKNTYGIQNIVDDNPFTAWQEGKTDEGIGQYFEFTYRFDKAAGWEGYCDQVWIANGYQKSKTLWEQNARVKKFKVSINQRPLAYVKLQDLMGEQSFSLNLAEWQKADTSSSARIKFEITEVYSGKKWPDVGISELYFTCGS